MFVAWPNCSLVKVRKKKTKSKKKKKKSNEVVSNRYAVTNEILLLRASDQITLLSKTAIINVSSMFDLTLINK